jgi:DNA-binding transcriptional LysR family regulator
MSGYSSSYPLRIPLAAEKNALWATLKDEHFIVSSDEPGPEIHDFIVKQLSELGHQPKVERYQVGRETLIVLVGLGLGVSLISEAGSAPSYPGVVFRPLADGENLLPFCAVWALDSDNPALRRLLSMARTMSRVVLPILFLLVGLPGYEFPGSSGEIIFD